MRESIRHNKASEGLQSQQITSTNDFRQDQLTERAINLRTRIGTSISSRLEKLRSSYANGFAPAEQQQAAIEEAISAEEANMKLLKMTPQEVESVIAPFKANIQKAYDEEAVAGGEKEIVTEKHSWMPDSTKKIETPEELVTALDQGVFGNPKSPTTFIKAATYARIYEIALTEKAKDALKAKAEAAKQPIN